MIIEICSKDRALKYVSSVQDQPAVISIVSDDEEDTVFPVHISSVLHLKFNDLTEEYDEDGIPYGRPVPVQEDLAGLKEFTDRLTCGHLIIHCWEGMSRSAAVAAAVYEYRGCRDTLVTHQSFAPNSLVYMLACRELGIRTGNLRYRKGPDGTLETEGRHCLPRG